MADQASDRKQRICWSSLHPDILGLIRARVIWDDITSFRQTCRSWRSITPPFPPEPDSPMSWFPYLFNIKDHTYNFFQPLYNETFQLKSQELKDAHVRYANCGWFLMSRGELGRFFFNPFTKVNIPLPDLPPGKFFSDEYFQSPPSSPNCMVIVFEKSGGGGLINFGFIRRGETTWTFSQLKRKHWERCEHIERKPKFSVSGTGDIVLHDDGRVYCLGEYGNIGVMTIGESGRVSFKVHTKPLFKKVSRKILHSYMLKCDGGLLVVFVTRQERHVIVKKLSLPEMTWHEVESLGDQLLYLSYWGSFLETAVNPRMADKIYFPIFHGKDGVYYSLKTKKYHSVIAPRAATIRITCPRGLKHRTIITKFSDGQEWIFLLL